MGLGGGSIKGWEESREVKLKSECKINLITNLCVQYIITLISILKSYEIYYF